MDPYALIQLSIGVVVGLLTGHIISGSLIGAIRGGVPGIMGAFAGDFLMNVAHIHFASGLMDLYINSALGALVIGTLLQLMRRAFAINR